MMCDCYLHKPFFFSPRRASFPVTQSFPTQPTAENMSYDAFLTFPGKTDKNNSPLYGENDMQKSLSPAPYLEKKRESLSACGSADIRSQRKKTVCPAEGKIFRRHDLVLSFPRAIKYKGQERNASSVCLSAENRAGRYVYYLNFPSIFHRRAHS